MNPFRPLEVLSADQVEAIHVASLRILSEIGLECLGDRVARRVRRRGGAMVDRATRRVRLDPAQVEELVALAPREFTLHARNPERDIVFGGAHLVFGAVGGPAFVSDLDRGRRAGNAADFRDYVRLIGALDVIHQEGGGPLEPTDLPVATRHLDMYRIFATELDKTWQCLGFGATPVEDALEVLAIVRGVDRETLVREPSAMTVINTNSPLRLDGPMGDGLIAMATYGQPVVATPFTLAGAMSPVSLAGAIAQQNAEALFLVALAQIVRPGAPMVYGAFTSNVDMRTGSPAFGTPESVKAQFAQRPDGPSLRAALAVIERDGVVGRRRPGGLRGRDGRVGRGHGRRQPAVPGRRLAGGRADRVVREAHPRCRDPADDGRGPAAARRLRGQRSASTPSPTSGPGGHFFGTAHTLERYETAFYRPILSDWRNFETWQADGARTATERANGDLEAAPGRRGAAAARRGQGRGARRVRRRGARARSRPAPPDQRLARPSRRSVSDSSRWLPSVPTCLDEILAPLRMT